MSLKEAFEKIATTKHALTTYDREFYNSLKSQFEEKGFLSESQEYHLNRIVIKYDPEEVRKREEWSTAYSDNHRLGALRCANYYNVQYPRYFGDIVDKVLSSPSEHVLSLVEYNKMCNNKYAKRVLAAYASPPRFEVGNFLQIRENNRLDLANKDEYTGFERLNTRGLRSSHCMVVEVDPKPITRAAKGARLYKVLVNGMGKFIYAHESDLKLARGINK